LPRREFESQALLASLFSRNFRKREGSKSMARQRRTGSRNLARGVLAFFWIALAGVSGVYLYSALADPSALSGQLANLSPLPVGSGETTSAFGGSGSRDKELAQIQATLHELTQQMAALSAKLNPDQKAASGEDSAASESEAEPASAPAPSPEVKQPEVAAATPAPAPAPPPPLEEVKPEEKPAEAPKPAEPEAKPVEQAAVETKPTSPVTTDLAPTPEAYEPPSVAVSPLDDVPEESEVSPDAPAPAPPAVEAAPTPAPSSSTPAATPATPAPSTPSPTTPAPTESAALDPVALPPAANDGSTRYGIEIGTVAKQDGLRPLWREFLTNHAALVAGLQPRRVLAPDKKWRLIAGPFSSAAEATQACALFKKASRPCEATVYAGDGL
jgi:hypothetical protein